MRKRIALVMQLFREAGKAVCAMPALLLQPIYVGISFCPLYQSSVLSNRTLSCEREILFSDVSTHWVYSSGVDLLHPLDRERRWHLQKFQGSYSFQEGRSTHCTWAITRVTSQFLFFYVIRSIACDITLINGINLGYKMVQSISVLRGVRILFGLSAYGRRLCRCSMVLHEVRYLVI